MVPTTIIIAAALENLPRGFQCPSWALCAAPSPVVLAFFVARQLAKRLVFGEIGLPQDGQSNENGAFMPARLPLGSRLRSLIITLALSMSGGMSILWIPLTGTTKATIRNVDSARISALDCRVKAVFMRSSE
ncbi:MAG: hypothetical protein IPI44_14490 [Sulfuritalea sp.]|nr:hypothetical protein [Sulfuritalea sp.]